MNPMNKTRTLSFRLAEDDYQKLVERCRVSELSQSKYLRYLIPATSGASSSCR